MSGNGPKTLARFGDLPGNAGNTKVTGNPRATAEMTFDRCGARHSGQGEVEQDDVGPENRRNCMTSAKMSLAMIEGSENDGNLLLPAKASEGTKSSNSKVVDVSIRLSILVPLLLMAT
jgi:hypothetical protein